MLDCRVGISPGMQQPHKQHALDAVAYTALCYAICHSVAAESLDTQCCTVYLVFVPRQQYLVVKHFRWCLTLDSDRYSSSHDTATTPSVIPREATAQRKHKHLFVNRRNVQYRTQLHKTAI